MLDVCLLGCGGMLPLPKRFLTSLIVRCQGKNVLIDCGEGTQVALHLCGWSVKNLDHILITHFHGDHVAGLPGLLMTIGNNQRTEPLHIWGPPGLKRIVQGLTVICNQLPFEVVCHELNDGTDNEFQAGSLTVRCLPVEHRVPCLAYHLELARVGRFDAEKAKSLDIPLQYWSLLQKGQSIDHDGRKLEPSMVMGVPRKGIKISYSTDCRPSEQLVEFVRGSDLYVAEGLYGDDEKKQGAKEKGHMVFSEAATIAKEAAVAELWLTHYSPALVDPEHDLPWATAIFPQSKCGKNLFMTTLNFDDEVSN